MLKESWFGAISTAGNNYSSHPFRSYGPLALPLTIPFQPLLLSTHPPCFMPSMFSPSLTTPLHHPLLLPNVCYSSLMPFIPPHRTTSLPTTLNASPPRTSAPHPRYLSPSPYTPPHRPIPLPIALSPSISPYTPLHRLIPVLSPHIPPHRPILLPIAPYSSPSPHIPPHRPITLPTAL